MSAPINSNPCCTTDTTTQIPGAPGATGAAGSNAFTLTTSTILLPASGSPVAVNTNVVSSAWMAIGEVLFVGSATFTGTFQVQSIPSPTSVQLKFLGYPLDSAAGSTIPIGATVTPSGSLPLYSALPAVITPAAIGVASNTIADTVGIFTLAIPIQLAAMTTSAASLISAYTFGFAFKILSIAFATTTLGAGAGATQTLNFAIGATNTTGGFITLTLATTTPLGNLIGSTALTALNTGTAADTITLKVAAGGTVFTGGAGVLLVRVQNLDDANAVATAVDRINSLINSMS